MELGIYCDNCQSNFDLETKIPLLLPQCGCTVCKECAAIIQRDSYCKKCNLPQTIDDFSSLRINQKIYAFVSLTQGKKVPSHPFQQDQEQQPSSSSQHSTPSQKQQQPPQQPIYSFQQQRDHYQPSGYSSSVHSNSSNKDNEQKDLKAGFQFFMRQASNNKSDSAKKSSFAEMTTTAHDAPSEKGNNMSIILEERTPANKASATSFRGIVLQNTESPSTTEQQQQQPAQLQTSFRPPSSSSNSQQQQQHHLPRQKSIHQQQQQQIPDMKKRQFCIIHLDKPLEYFCQQCIKTVCSKCMFHHHNGHDLSQMDDALKVLLAKLTNFDQKVKDVLTEHEELKSVLLQHKSEVETMRAKQLQIIDQRFLELQLKLEERKQLLSKELMHKYDNSMFKANDKIRYCKEQSEEMASMQVYYHKMMEKLSNETESILNSDGTLEQIEILGRVPEFDKFIYENMLKLKNFQLQHKTTKNELQGGEMIGLKPSEVTVNHALTLISTITFDNIPLSHNMPASVISKKPSSSQLLTTPPQHSHSQHQEEDEEKRASSLNASFNFPKSRLPLANTTLTQKRDPSIPNPKPHHLNLTNQSLTSLPGSVSFSKPTLQLNDTHQIAPPVATGLSSTAGGQGTKFVKLKFNRQGTSHSQELCLQVEPSQRQQPLPLPLPQQKEENKYVVMLEEDDQEEIQSQKVKLLDNAIYCIGDSRYLLMFDYRNQLWQQVFYDKRESDYQGTLKFMSICQINHVKKREFIMTGGCNKATLEPSNQCFRFTIPTIRQFHEVSRMKCARYGHCSVYINQLVLVLGGFNHRDDEAQAPNTLNTGEKYSVKENEWTPIAPMQQERAYFSACRVKEEFVYVFGGFQNYETSSSIEFYNIMLDKWTLLSITMPLKLAKYGLAKLDDSSIVICGGLLIDNASTRSATENASYSCVNTVYKFDCNTLKWTKLAKLNFRRTLYSTMAVRENGQIFAIGGTVEGINEVYDIRKKKWNTCQSYTSIMGQNDLQTYAICSLNRHNGSGVGNDD